MPFDVVLVVDVWLGDWLRVAVHVAAVVPRRLHPDRLRRVALDVVVSRRVIGTAGVRHGSPSWLVRAVGRKRATSGGSRLSDRRQSPGVVRDGPPHRGGGGVGRRSEKRQGQHSVRLLGLEIGGVAGERCVGQRTETLSTVDERPGTQSLRDDFRFVGELMGGGRITNGGEVFGVVE